jgi:hypothetical protein
MKGWEELLSSVLLARQRLTGMYVGFVRSVITFAARAGNPAQLPNAPGRGMGLMSNKVKITLPPLPQGATGYRLYRTWPKWEIAEDKRTFYARLMYRAYVFLYDRAEALWHWCYDKSRRYAPRKKDGAEVTYVSPYVKGPDGAPLLPPRETVYAVTR